MQPRRAMARTAVKSVVDTIRRHKPDYHIILYMGLLMLLGLIVIYAIGPQRANFLNSLEGTDFNDSFFFIKQAISLLAALGMFALMATIPYKIISKYAAKILIAGFGACALLVILGNVFDLSQLALCTKGACRWFIIPGLGTIQPAELLKFGILVFTASFLGLRMQQGLINDRDKTLIPLGAMLGLAVLFVIVLQKDMGTGISLVAILLTMLVAAGMKWKLIGMAIATIGIAGLMLVVTAPHRLERVATYFQGDSAPADNDESHHINQAKIAIGSGGLFGLGIGNSVQASGYLPEAINDSVFAVMGETFGFIGLVIILALFTGLLLRLLKIYDHLGPPELRLVVAGVFGWLGSHVMLNVAAMIGLVPLTGITLPLLSFGGTSMVFIVGALGLAFQLSRYTSHRVNKETDNEDSRSRRGVGRTRYASGRGSSRI
ncbi:Lipid II flippase FtsW [compost metagenome]